MNYIRVDNHPVISGRKFWVVDVVSMEAFKQNVPWLQSTSSPTLMVTMKADSKSAAEPSSWWKKRTMCEWFTLLDRGQVSSHILPEGRISPQGRISADQPGIRIMWRAICSPGSAHLGTDWPRLPSGDLHKPSLKQLFFFFLRARENKQLLCQSLKVTYVLLKLFFLLGGATVRHTCLYSSTTKSTQRQNFRS